jgi:hypothetical protein
MYARILAALMTLALGAPMAVAQEPAAPAPCADSESLKDCFDRIQRELTPAAPPATEVDALTKRQKDTVNEELSRAETGADSGSPATAATMNDLAQLLNALGLLSSGDSAEGSKLSVDLGFLLPVQDVENNNSQLKAVINTEPEPLDQLVQAFAEEVREARKDALQKDIRVLGDAQVLFTWGLVNERFGRDYSVLRKNIALMNQGAVSRVYAAADKATIQAFNDVIAEISEAGGSPVIRLDKQEQISAQKKEEFKTAAFNAAVTRAGISRNIQHEIARARLDQLADLVEQQPQLLFTLEHDFRDEIIGPETTSATVTWEITRRNMGAFLRGEGRVCKENEVATGNSPQYDSCVKALQAYMSAYGAELQTQPRFKVEASYKRVDSVNYSFPDDGIDLSLPKRDRWEVGVAAGWPLPKDKNGGRVDFELSYDSNLDDDDTNKERVTAALTYTRRVGDVDMPLSIVYANKNEFLGEVDHQISLNIGVKFRQPQK